MSSTPGIVTVDDQDTTRITYRGDWHLSGSSSGAHKGTVHLINTTAGTATFNFNGMSRPRIAAPPLMNLHYQARLCESTVPFPRPRLPPHNTRWTGAVPCYSHLRTSLHPLSNSAFILHRLSTTAHTPLSSSRRAMGRIFISILYSTVLAVLRLMQPAWNPLHPLQWVPR
jgi:hypothetical protein